MPRPSLTKVSLPNYKGRPNFLTHKTRRDAVFDNPSVRYPIYSRLPESWRRAFEAKPPVINQKLLSATKRPHHPGLWVKKDGLPVLARNVPLRVTYSKEVQEGLWGGEGIIKGFIHGKNSTKHPLHPKDWKPALSERTMYSEVLEREITAVFSRRALDLVDEAFGFDHYILKTPGNELCSELGGRLKREMLLRLLNKDEEMYQLDPAARERIYKRYKKYIVPREEAEWVGLTLREAMEKQWNLEKEKGLHDSVPLLKIYTEELKTNILAAQKQKAEGEGQRSTEAPVFSAPGTSAS